MTFPPIRTTLPLRPGAVTPRQTHRVSLASLPAWVLAGAIFTGALLPATICHAQSPAKVFAEAELAYQDEEYQRAAELFELADQTKPHPAAMLNAARARERAKQPARAADNYAECLRRSGLSASDRDFAKQRLVELRAKLGRITILAPPRALVSLGHHHDSATPLLLHLEPGTHELTTRTPNEVKREQVVVKAGETTTFRVEIPQATSASSTKPAPRSSPPWLPLTTGFLVGAGAAGGVAVGLGLVALNARDDYDDSRRQDLDARSTAQTYRTAANITWVAAGALTATGATLLTLGLLERDDTNIDVGVGHLSFRLSF